MDLSIIVPTLNKEWFYKYFIDDLEAHKLELKYELITVEDRLVNDARNEWVAQATWKYILVVNDDILLGRKSVWKLIAAAEKWWEDKVYCPLFIQSDTSFLWGVSFIEDNICWFCFLMYRDKRPVIDNRIKIRYGDNRIYERLGRKVERVEDALIHHFGSRTVQTADKQKYIREVIENDKKERAEIKEENGW